MNDFEETVDKKVVREFIYFLIFLLAIVGMYLFVSSFMTKTYAVDGESMYPTLHDDDIVYTEKRTFSIAEIYRHDIVIIKLQSGFNIVKRVIGVSGDVIRVENGGLYVNGIFQEETYINAFEEGLIPADMPDNIVPEGYIFVMGDNRLHSSDSREFGFMSVEIVQAKVKSVVWPLDRKGINLYMK